MTCTKSVIVDDIVDKVGYTRRQAVDIVENLLEIIKSTLEAGDDILISGFGKFCVRGKRSRRGRNPATGEAMLLDSRRVVTFKCAGKLRDRING